MKKTKLIIKLFIISATMNNCGNSTKNDLQQNKANQALSFREIKIGNQIWMAQNLNVSKFSNGDLIPEAKTIEEWNNASKSEQAAWCYYENDSIIGAKYGKLYNYYAINDSRGLAPDGWNIPNSAQWTELINSLGGEQEAGAKIIIQNDSSQCGFNSFISLYRCNNGKWNLDENEIDPIQAIWWSYENEYCQLVWGRSSYLLNVAKMEPREKNCGFSIRCIKKISNKNESNINQSFDCIPYEPKKGTNERQEILDIFRADCSPQTKFKVEHFQICNDWACACVTPTENNIEIAEPRWHLFKKVNSKWKIMDWNAGLSLNDDFELIDLPKQNSRVAKLIVAKYPSCPMAIFSN